MSKVNWVVGIMLFLLSSSILSCNREERSSTGQISYSVNPDQLQKVIPVVADEFYRGVGTVKSKNTAQLSSKIMGYISEIKVKEGDLVNAGDLLIVLTSKETEARLEAAHNTLLEIERNLREAEAAEAEAQAQLQLAEVTFRRFEELNQRGSVSLQEFDQAKANYDVAQARRKRTEEARSSLEARKKQIIANLEEAKTFYNYTRIKAPFAGLITQKIVAEGDLASPGSPLLVIEDNHHYQLEVFIDESQVSKIKTGEIIEVEIDASGEGKIKGKVSEIIPQVDPVTRTFLVKVDLPLLPSIKSGMFGKAYFPVGKRTCILVPREALLECGQLSSLFIVNPQGQVERRLVKSGKEYDGKVEILSGLDIGETIVVRDIFKVKEGCRVGKKS